LFSLADARGNNPHGTRESAYDEGRRLNAGRYETVGDLDRALDERARPRVPLRVPMGAQPEQPPPAPAPTGLLGVLALLAVGAGIAYVMMRKDPEEVEDDELRANPLLPAPASTAPAAVQSVVVHPTPVPTAAAAAQPTVGAEPAPVAKRRRRAKKVVVEDAVTVVPTATPTPAVVVVPEAPVTDV
jgi:hypothetical protein